ncbi:ABC transporter permease [Pseudooceanicola sp. LIPI14-2-Ac024]|uniref:ABC transporter permease n=1 Tax=Pseudooceanicola sp. LIPI14-2-Ac024 TaxID=3344875 RepID=UPI0035CF76A0
MMARFSPGRFMAVLSKEFVQMRRDRITFVMMIGVPIMQLLIFGYAINSDPRNLPTLVEMVDDGPITRSIVSAMETSTYFDFQGVVTSAEESDRALRDGTANFVFVIPANFERDVLRGLAPEVLLEADASDPTAVGGAANAMSGIISTAMAQVMSGPLAAAASEPAAFDVVVHRAYNPEGDTSVNIVPGLLGIILSLTMVMITAVAIVRERERGTMETLIATPVRPSEVMMGKIAPYVLVGYVQTVIFLLAARALFDIPFAGSVWAFFVGFNLFIVVNLALGFLISTVARSQMQAMQISFFTLLPTVLLSGFMFPFAAMPGWAQAIGSAIPATHFLRIVRKVMLKGAGLGDILHDLAAICLILLVITVVALRRYRQTLD